MKRLLRGVIDFGGTISEDNLAFNFRRLRTAKLKWLMPEDTVIFNYVSTFFNNNLALPSSRTVADFLSRSNDVESQARLGDIAEAAAYTRSDYANLLSELIEQQNKIEAQALLKEAGEIISRGLDIKEGREKVRLFGIRDAIVHFTNKSQQLLPQDSAFQVRGDIRDDAAAAWDEYSTAKHDKSKAWGKFTGIEEIDSVCRGLRKGEMWVHAAFTGELKTVYAINWAYNLVTRYRTNVMYCSFEVPYTQLRRLIVVRHSAHPKFMNAGKKPLDYRKVRDGELTTEEELFYKDVLHDWETCEDYCRLHLWCPDHDVNMNDVRLEAELLHKQLEIGFVVLDHGALMSPVGHFRDYNIALNSIMRDAKKLALYFNHGEGIPLLMLFQINRDGKDAADKSEGRYRIRALSYANECVAKGTLVATRHGYAPIETISVGQEVYSSTGFKKVLSVFDQGVRPAVRITTKDGPSVVCTPDHKFRVIGEDGLEWVEAKDLLGKTVVSLMSVTGRMSLQAESLPPFEFAPKEPMRSCFKIPTKMTPELAYLLGSYVVSDNTRTDKVSWRSSRTNRVFRRMVEQHFKTVFGHNLTVTKGTAQMVCAKDYPALRVWMDKLKSDIPKYILSAPREAQLSYVRGMWDNIGKLGEAPEIMASRKSWSNPVIDVNTILNGAGIPTNLLIRNNDVFGTSQIGVKCTILAENRAEFFKGLGYAIPEGLEAPLDVIHGFRVGQTAKRLILQMIKKYRDPENPYPLIIQRLRESAAYGKGNIRTRHLEAFLKWVAPIEGSAEDPGIQAVAQIAKLRAHVVIGVATVEPVHMYDLEVGGDHEYLTGGLLTHNCERSADTITTTYLNDDHRKAGTTVCCCLKNRDNPLFDPFILGVDFSCRRLYRLDPTSLTGQDMGVNEHDAILNSLMDA